MKQIVFIMFLVFGYSLFAQTSLPGSVKVYLPSYIEKSSDNNNQDWLDKIKRLNYGKSTNTFWIVYSDREGNQTFTEPNDENPYTKLKYGQKLIIADIQNNFALVYEPSELEENYPKVKGVTKGWIRLDNLLLWDKCPMDNKQVYRKAVVLLNLDANSKGDISPDFLSNPKTKDKTGKAANKLEFYFIMKTTNINGTMYYLLSKEWQFSSSIGGVNNLYGWLSEGNISTWDNRLCFEPNWDGKAVTDYNLVGIKPMVLKTKDEALDYKRNGNADVSKAFWIDEALSTKRNHPQLIRLPLISDETGLPNGIYKVASIGQIGKTNPGNIPVITPEERAKAEADMQNLIIKLNNVNIIFVVDGTISMGKYFKPIADAIDRSMRKDLKSSYKFGAVVYRDYSDEDKSIEKQELTDNYEMVSNFINRCEAKQPNGKDKNLEEAMFLGLETALNFKFDDNQSNFIFLIGDCGNHNPDPVNKNINNIVKEMINKRVNILAFQANNEKDKAFNAFTLQAKKIISNTIDGITIKANAKSSVDIKLNSRGLYKTYRIGKNPNILTPVLGAYTFCNPYESKDPEYLKSLIEDMIKEFDEVVSERIMEFQNFLSGSSSGAIGKIPDAIREEFKLRGWSDERINALKGEEQMKIAGYTCDNPGNKRYGIFVPVLFISHEEYSTLLKNLKKLNSNEFVSNRTAYYEALKSLALTFFGNINVENIEIDALMGQVYGIPDKFKPTTLSGIKIIDVLEPKRVSQYKLKEFIDNFSSRMPRFEIIQKDDDYKFLSNGLVYYWIPVNELP